MTSPNEIFKQYRDMCHKNIILSFKGAITQEILVDLGEIIKNNIGDLKDRPRVIKRVFSIFIEVAQNILHHSAEKVTEGEEKGKGSGILVVTESSDQFEIVSGNLIANANSQSIEDLCKLVNSLDKESLKTAFRAKIREPFKPEKKGAGLGLLDIARKSENKIGFNIEKVDETHSFFILSVKIQK